MKRESIAETTLRKQVKALDAEIDSYIREIDLRRYSIDMLQSLRLNLLNEIERLREQRLAASERKKP